MGVKEGYKRTEIGVIPEGWEVKQLGQLFEITSSKRVYKSDWRLSGVPFYRARELAILGEKGIVNNELFISQELYNSFFSKYGVPKANDILITGVGTLGKLFIVKPKDSFYFKDGNIIWLKSTKNTNSKFIKYLYQTPQIIKQIEDSSAGTTVGTYTIINAKKTIVPIPPLPEQKAIATALSDIDGLIDSISKLIKKKKNIKQGAMQELLTGKKRLDGSSGEWVFRTMGNLFKFSGGYSASRDQLSTEGHSYLHYGDIHGSVKTFVDIKDDYLEIPKLNIELNKISKDKHLQDGDVVFVDASEDDEGVSRHVVIRNTHDIPFISGLHTIVAKSRTNELYNLYKEYCFQSKEVKKQFAFYAVGIKVSGISRGNIIKIVLKIPPTIEEQNAIATILSNMDSEIEKLQSKLDKYKAIKQGMMQELLTGRIRLLEGA
jgi:type I restriction enzyme, S subunit